MRRREVIALLSGAAAWSVTVRAQQSATPRIGFLHVASPKPYTHILAALRRGLNETGYVEGQNVTIEYRWAEGRDNQLPTLAMELVGGQVRVIVAGGPAAALAAKAATTVIPIVFVTSDAVTSGLVASLNRPGGNRTGVDLFTSAMEPKRLEILQELVPAAARLVALVNPDSHLAPSQTRDLQEAGRHIGRSIEILNASTEPELEAVFAALSRTRSSALLVAADPFFNSRREHIVMLAARHSIPAIYEWREFVEAGGLMSYGTSLADGYRQAGVYTGRILNGERPADLPVLQPTKFEFVINLNAAKALGLDVPPSLLVRADEVIE